MSPFLLAGSVLLAAGPYTAVSTAQAVEIDPCPRRAGPGVVEVRVDVNTPGSPVAKEVFGVNMPWTDFGGGAVTNGDLVQDRSFQDFGTMASAWDGPGTILRVTTDGDPAPPFGAALPGCVRLLQIAPGSTIVTETLAGGVAAGVQYTVRFSTKLENGMSSPLSLALWDPTFTTLLASNVLMNPTGGGVWSSNQLTLTPSQSESAPRLRHLAAGVAPARRGTLSGSRLHG